MLCLPRNTEAYARQKVKSRRVNFMMQLDGLLPTLKAISHNSESADYISNNCRIVTEGFMINPFRDSCRSSENSVKMGKDSRAL